MVRVIVNSDDILVFDQSVSEEYIKLYAEELEIIRNYGLERSLKGRTRWKWLGGYLKNFSGGIYGAKKSD